MLMDSVGQEFRKISGNGLSLLWSLSQQNSSRWGDSKGWWLESSGNFFTHLSGTSAGIAGKPVLAGTVNWSADGHVASPTWWPQSSQTPYMAVPGSQKEGSSKRGKNCVTLCDLVVGVTWHQFCSFLLVTNLLMFKWRGRRPHLLMGEMSKNLWPCFKTTKSSQLRCHCIREAIPFHFF